ncbi:DUF2336 domain-containing protein [Xanthobacteraceae bacterium Astr-EGSB]|uniref:DUF2336 domain-containing protein n=1 Tax=Astrobacterium formosum TaxID=3069710 RepID=UPI0027AE6ABC|nr:DUF2336 domain-containing protein [Xanthobacteraceae bacterium Astr-EGSB]
MPDLHDELKSIAAERSSEKRLQLLHKIADLFLVSGGARTDVENYLFNDIMEKIVDQISRDAKVQVAANLATLRGFPASIARSFAADEDIDIARPVLRGSPVLGDDDLVGIAKTAGQQHLHAIATRDQLSTVITDVLIDRGDERVVHRVSANHGASFSDWGFEQLVEKARRDVDLQELLVERPDISRSTIDSLLPLVSETLALKLAQRGYDPDSANTPDLRRLAREQFEEALRDRRVAIRGVTALGELIARGDLTVEEALIELVESGRLFDVAVLASKVADLDRNHVFGLITRGQIQVVMLFFRALDVSLGAFERIMVLRARKLGLPAPDAAELARDYVMLDKSLAQRAIRFLQARHRLTKPKAEEPVRQLAAG